MKINETADALLDVLDDITVHCGYAIASRVQEVCDVVKRWSAGDFTREEIHNFCHKIAATVPRCEFEAGCRAHTDSLYGPKLDWVNRKPTVPGRYLFNYKGNPGQPYEFTVIERDGALVLRRRGRDMLVDHMSLNRDDRWYGPIPDESITENAPKNLGQNGVADEPTG